MILSVTLSKPVKNIADFLGKDFIRIKIKLSASAQTEKAYFAEFYTKTQAFHKKMSMEETQDFIDKNAGKTFKNCVIRTESEEITVLANKKGEITRLEKKIDNALVIGAAAEGRSAPAEQNGAQRRETAQSTTAAKPPERPYSPMKNLLKGNSLNRRKNYILEEGKPVPFLVRLGIMTAEGKTIASKYDKFRQINRFLETIKDVVAEIHDSGKELNIVDFGSGKSYLTFAVQYYLTTVLNLKCRIFGLDLKKEVIEYCSRLASELELENLSFAVGDIAKFSGDKRPDIVITLHACDTATDYALDYAVKHGARAILSVPCCQHEINSQLRKTSVDISSPLEPLVRYGLIKERFSALATDALRGEFLENAGYRVQMLEFIDDEGTPKNLMIKAVRTQQGSAEKKGGAEELLAALNVKQTLYKI